MKENNFNHINFEHQANDNNEFNFNNNELIFNVQNDKNEKEATKYLLVFKTFVFIFIFAFLFIGKLYFVPSIDTSCLNDPIHNFLQYFNQQINKGNDATKALQISSSLLMDFSFIVVFIYWVKYTNNSRLILVVSGFYTFRALNQALIQMSYPQGFYWTYPGFPSLVVPYGRTSDFFFSGHTGFLTICLFEWKTVKNFKMFFLTLAILLYMIVILLIFRTHYSIDIMMGFVCAHYIFTLVNNNIIFFDSWLKYLLQKLHGRIFKNKIYDLSQKNSNLSKNIM